MTAATPSTAAAPWRTAVDVDGGLALEAEVVSWSPEIQNELIAATSIVDESTGAEVPIAVAFGEALTPAFKDYQQKVKDNAAELAARLLEHGLDIVSGGTDNHIVLVDLQKTDVTGAEEATDADDAETAEADAETGEADEDADADEADEADEG